MRRRRRRIVFSAFTARGRCQPRAASRTQERDWTADRSGAICLIGREVWEGISIRVLCRCFVLKEESFRLGK